MSWQDAVVDRIRGIAEWRRGREEQDMLGLGPEQAQRSARSARGLADLAEFIAALPPDDPRLSRLQALASYGDLFDPGALLLTALGRFRFHDPDAPLAPFLGEMCRLAEQDRAEMGQWGGPQLDSDNPWKPAPPRDPDEIEAEW